MDNSVDDVYGSKAGVDFAKIMAEVLSKRDGYVPDASMAVLPGTWMYNLPKVVDAIAGTQYRDIMGSQDKTIKDRITDPNTPTPNVKYGSPIKNRVNTPSKGIGSPTSSATPFVDTAAAPAAPNITTASLPSPADTTTMPSATAPDSAGSFGGLKPLSEDFFRKVKSIENNTGNPAYINSHGYKGDYQFSDAELKKYGVRGRDWANPKIMEPIARTHFNDLKRQLYEATGKEPTDGQVYLAHQRGLGGVTKGMQNPDQPEWVNMLNTGEGRARYARNKQAAVDWAQTTVTDNVPKTDPTKRALEQKYGNQWYLHMTSAQFQPIWSRRFDGNGPAPTQPTDEQAAAAINDNVPSEHPEIKEPTGEEATSSLGGGPTGVNPDTLETGAVGEGPSAPGIKTAQAFPVSPTENGPSGPVPPASPFLSDPQLKALLRASDLDKAPGIIKDYLESRKDKEFETTFGKGTVTGTEPGKPPIVTHTNTKTVPLSIDGITVHITPDGRGGLSAIIPGEKGPKDFKDVDALWDYVQRGKARGTDYNTRALKKADRYEDAQAHVEQNLGSAQDRGTQLELAEKFVNDPNFISGMLRDKRETLSKFWSWLDLEAPGGGADVTQAFVKLISGSILSDITSLGGKGLGPIRAKEMEIIQNMNATPDLNPGAVRAVVRLTKKANDRLIEYHDKAMAYAKDHGGQLDENFYQEMHQYYKNKPLLSEKEIGHYNSLFQPGKNNPPEGGREEKKTPTSVESSDKKVPRFNAQTGKWE